MNPPRRIAHLDMDAFFASVELLTYPELRGQAVVVGGRSSEAPQPLPGGGHRFARLGDYVGRGVVTTSTYPARALGVFSGMGLMQSARLAPDAVLLPANFPAYREASRGFKAAVAAICPLIEDRGIDEIYLDLSNLPEDSRTLATQLQQAVFAATGLSCSIGITPNKLLAKIASDLDKPNGITILTLDDLPTRIWPLPARSINGIGPRASERLTRLGIDTIGALAATPLETLIRTFGRNTGEWMHRAAHGIDSRGLVTERNPKSVSRESTFSRDLHARQDRDELSVLFTDLCVRVAADLNRHELVGRTIGIKLRYADFRTLTRDLTLPVATADAGEIRCAAGRCLARVPLQQRLRLLGVRVSGLLPATAASTLPVPQPSGIQGELPL